MNRPGSHQLTVAPTRDVYCVGDVQLALECEPADLSDELSILYRGCRQTQHEFTDDAIQVSVRRAGSRFVPRRRFTVLIDGEHAGPKRRARELVPAVEWAVNARVIAAHSEFLQIHAAGMVDPVGRGVLLVGPSGCGKSTLSLALLQHGWRYLCDELALIEPNLRRVHPFPKAFCIKSSGFALLERRGIPLSGRTYAVKDGKGRVAYVNPFDLVPDAAGGPSPIRIVIFPQHSKQMEPRISPLSPGKAMFGLSGGVLNRSAFGQRVPGLLYDLVHGAECFSLRSGDLDKTCELIDKALGFSR